MDFSELIERLYEMNIEMCVIRETPGSKVSINSTVGRIEEYDLVVEIIFENDDQIDLCKEDVAEIYFGDYTVSVIMSNGIKYLFSE